MTVMSAEYMRDWRAKQLDADGFLPFQREFTNAVTRKRNPPAICALSAPRASGKSWLCGRLVARSITPGDELFEEGCENILIASSRNQAMIVLEFARAALGESEGYRWRVDGVVHIETRTRVRIVSSDSRRALGLGASCRLAVADEPASWAPQSGRRLWDALATALGKRRMTLCAIGSLAPSALSGSGSFLA